MCSRINISETKAIDGQTDQKRSLKIILRGISFLFAHKKIKIRTINIDFFKSTTPIKNKYMTRVVI